MLVVFFFWLLSIEGDACVYKTPTFALDVFSIFCVRHFDKVCMTKKKNDWV